MSSVAAATSTSLASLFDCIIGGSLIGVIGFAAGYFARPSIEAFFAGRRKSTVLLKEALRRDETKAQPLKPKPDTPRPNTYNPTTRSVATSTKEEEEHMDQTPQIQNHEGISITDRSADKMD